MEKSIKIVDIPGAKEALDIPWAINYNVHLEVDVEAMADCIFSKYSDCADIRIAEHLSTNIPKWARLVRR